MKVLQIVHSWGMGGVEQIVVSLDNYLQKENIDSYIIINADMYNKFIEHFNIKSVSNIYQFNPANIFTTIRDIAYVIKIIHPNIVHTHARRECVYAALVKYAQAYIHIRTQHMAEFPKKKVSVFEKMLMKKNVNCWVATSHTLEKAYIEKLDYIDKKKVRVICNGVKCAITDRRGLQEKANFCIISRLTKQKGIDILLDNISKMPAYIREKIFIDLYGEGEELDAIKKMICDLGLSDQIVYRGKTSETQKIVGKYLALLMPSRKEGFPLTMLEAMAVGTPVAIHEVGCVSEVITSGVNGWIVNSSYTWENFFTELLTKNTNYKKISERARQTYLYNFSEEKMCSRYLALYENLV